MDPRLWLYLDNLRSGWSVNTNMTTSQTKWAAKEAREKGFVDDTIQPNRLTTKGEIALRFSLTEVNNE